MESNISSFAKLSEPDRMIFIARLHHAIWYDEKLFRRLEYFMNHLEKKLPEATYFPEITEEL